MLEIGFEGVVQARRRGGGFARVEVGDFSTAWSPVYPSFALAFAHDFDTDDYAEVDNLSVPWVDWTVAL